VTVECDEIQALIKCGAFDEVCNMTRPATLWRWNFLQASGQNALPGAAALAESAKTLFATVNPQDVIDAALAEMQTPEYTIEQKLKYEREILEVCVSGHPLDFLPRNGEVWSDENCRGCRGKRVTLCGWVGDVPARRNKKITGT